MPKFYQILLLLDQFLPIELTRLVAYIYIIVPSQKNKPGQFILDSPCGHLLKCIINYECKTFVCPFSKKIYSYNREIFYGTLRYHARCHVVEYDVEGTLPRIFCEICYREWDIYDKCETSLQMKTACFCGKIVDQLPCESCAILTKKCSMPDCKQLSIQK